MCIGVVKVGYVDMVDRWGVQGSTLETRHLRVGRGLRVEFWQNWFELRDVLQGQRIGSEREAVGGYEVLVPTA